MAQSGDGPAYGSFIQ